MKPKCVSLIVLIASLLFLAGCENYSAGNTQLTRNTLVELVDWHISGFWVINCPVAWIRVTNRNQVPIKNIVIQYNTFDEESKPLNEGTFTIEETVPPNTVSNFIELYMGLVGLRSEQLSIKLLNVSPGT